MKRGILFAGLFALAACSSTSGDGPSQDDMRDALTRYGQKVQSTERIACKVAPDRPGFICDFKAVTCTTFTKKCDRSLLRTGRFVQVSGNWMFMGDVSDPSRGFTPEPEPSATDAGNTVVTDLSPTPTPAPTPSASASPKPSPTPTASPSPKPTPSASPTPKPTGVNRVWLSGRWSAAKGDCEARRATNFGSGGGFYGKRGRGNWRLKDKTLTLDGTYEDGDKPFKQVVKVERTGDNAMTLDGKRYQRCDN